MMTRILTLSLAVAALALAGCQKSDDTKSQQQTSAAKPTQTAAAGANQAEPVASDPAATADHSCGGDCGGEGHECGGEAKGEGEGHECGGEEATNELTADKLEERTDATGRKVMHAGQEFTEATAVTVADLVDHHADYLGKTVSLEGNIMAMCTHRRAWLAMTGKDDNSGKQLRAFTVPVFLVPEGSIGKSVRIEGTVDEVEVPAEQAKHFAEEHKLDIPEGDGPIKQPVLRATAADFYE